MNEPTSNPIITSIEGTVLALKLDHLKEQMTDVVKLIAQMQETLKVLVRVEEQQRDFRGAIERAFADIKIARERIDLLEREMPSNRTMRRWVYGGVITGVGMIAAALFNLLVIAPMYRGYGYNQAPTISISPGTPSQEREPR